MAKLTLLDEFENFNNIYGEYYMSQMFVDYKGYKSIRAMNSYEDIYKELFLLNNLL
mgnify:CR=1 FL=1